MAGVKSPGALLDGLPPHDHEATLQAAQAALKTNPKDVGAQLITIVALLKLDRFDDVVKFFESKGPHLKQRAPLEYAYALYKTSALEDAARALAESSVRTAGILHMQAQVAYRKEDFAQAARVYASFSERQGLEHDQESDFRVNQSAVRAQILWSDVLNDEMGYEPQRGDLDQFEIAFNVACAYIARGDLPAAEFLLAKARDLCLSSEDLSEEEKKAEVSPIAIQLTCVQCRQEKYEEAATTASAIRLVDIGDAATRRVALANQIAARESVINPYRAQQAFRSLSRDDQDSLTFTYQEAALSRSMMAIETQAHKFSHAVKTASEKPWAGVYVAAAHVQNQHGELAIAELLALLKRRKADVGLLMTVIQLCILDGQAQAATEVLQRFMKQLEQSTNASDKDVRFSNGLVSLLVSLYAGQNRTEQARRELEKAAQHWRQRIKETRASLPLLRAAAAAQLEKPFSDGEDFARQIIEAVNDNEGRSMATTAGLLAAGVQPSDKSGTGESTLQSIEALTLNINAEALDAAGVATVEKTVPTLTSSKRPAQVQAKPRKAPQIRKSRMPKDYDPSKTPDPERWLPLHERSTWRPKGKKKNKSSQGMAMQGGISNQDTGASAPQQQSNGQQKATANSKSKKKKGKSGR
ncbi:MAG: hypothetical protein Q9162_001725 [Coniocarpon cinnabarinum]